MVLEKSTGIQLESVEVVLDFGGGSSSQAQAMRRLGFQGTYFIFDLPPVSLLQRFSFGWQVTLQFGSMTTSPIPPPL